MPYIVPNNLLKPTEKVIKPYNCSMIAVDGPQIKGKLNMEGLEIPYVSQYTSQMVLNESSKDQPVLYGFLGNNVTFLMIKATYEPQDPNWAIEADEYIEYYFADDPTIRYMGKLMILTGNSLKRISQIYLSNPNDSQKVYLEIFMANQSQEDIDATSGLLQSVKYISGLYYNNILSDSISSGSTSLNIVDADGNLQLVIPYENINTIERTNDGTNRLIIGTDSEEDIQLDFLSDFNMKQAHSRISWVLEDTANRNLTSTTPGIDLDAPVVTWTMSGSTTSGYTILPWDGSSDITKDYIIQFFMSGVTDTRDGDMSIMDTVVTIYNEDDMVPISVISSDGKYVIYFTVEDIAGNTDSHSKYAIVFAP